MGTESGFYEHFYSAMMQDGESTESSEILQKQLFFYMRIKMQGMGENSPNRSGMRGKELRSVRLTRRESV